MRHRFAILAIFFALFFCGARFTSADRAADDLKRIGLQRGIVVVVGLGEIDVQYLVKLCDDSELTLFFQTPDQQLATDARQAADVAGYLGKRIFVETGSNRSIHLGDNVADRVLVVSDQAEVPGKDELLRALRPRGIALVGGESIRKPVPGRRG